MVCRGEIDLKCRVIFTNDEKWSIEFEDQNVLLVCDADTN